MLSYERGAEAMSWLVAAFGFVEKTRMLAKDGRLSHGELDTGDGLVMLASPTPDYESPRRHRDACAAAKRWSAVPWVIDGVHVYVDDVDAHFARAKAAGAEMLSEIQDGPPGRRYRCEDVEGHRWMFMERAR
jgi:uncharacterized glyoxalase superfamily protein PhnB